ncbi:MAG: fasciclin domain-containing protein, partial [Prevotella sp.]|nr:fasciclin domain-containing protein [Prevotella sp.]
MNYRFFELSRKALCGLCLAVVSGGFFSCHDRFDLDEPGSYPSWLGESVYDQLKNPNPEVLTGTFNNYLRLIDDLGYAETLARTGSKTVFPANDEAFERFFRNNSWGVSKYEDLSEAMKKQLLNSSMLNNAILVEMLSNASVSNELQQGVVLKHRIDGERYDSITHISSAEGMPKNNVYWEKFYDKGIDLVMDATDPMMVHFTVEQMVGNNITTRGEGSDFEIITGSKYNEAEKSAYIFRNRIIKSDVTCKNGYIHQVEDVLVPPGNLAELIRNNGQSNYFSRLLDRFSVPFFESNLTRRYNDYAQAYGKQLIDSIFQMRYFSQRSQGGKLSVDPNAQAFPNLLNYDPGWNAYTNGMSGSNELSDLVAIFVPTDEAMKQYLLPGGSGAFLIDQFGAKENTENNLLENIDSIPDHIVVAFLNNLMKSSFVNTVPSKFGDIMDDASDPMGLKITDLNRNANGAYDVKIANNGVAYMLNTVFAPNQYVAVSAPAFFSDNMRIMNTAIQDGKQTLDDGTTLPLGLNMHYYAYLLAMSANYGLFIPTDSAFSKYYVDPTTLGGDQQPRALRFHYDGTKSPYVYCTAWKYNKLTGEVGTELDDYLGSLSTGRFKTQLMDILNYHTVVLKEGEKMGTNLYYKTKHGGAVKYENGTVMSGGQIDEGLPVSNIEATYNQKNGTAFSIDHLIQAPQKSVYAVLKGTEQFSDFFSLLNGFDGNDDLFWFASDKMKERNSLTKKTRRDGYKIFVIEAGHYGLDYDVKFFNSYNYTVYAPDNDAMQKAYALGLPKWEDIQAIYDSYK